METKESALGTENADDRLLTEAQLRQVWRYVHGRLFADCGKPLQGRYAGGNRQEGEIGDPR